MDELAQMAEADPLEFRLKHLAEGRLKNVLNAAADQFGWNRRRREKPPNRGVGLACGTEKGSYTAACVEVEVRDGEIHVLEACQAFECGAIQNPQNLKSQVAGCLMMGLGAALFEQIEFEDGKISNPWFSSYRVPRMSDMPEIEVVLLDRKDLPSVGAGETPIIAIAPAIANAAAQVTGKRCRSMPIALS
jgi:isoquinoline 1-oxidoreductase